MDKNIVDYLKSYERNEKRTFTKKQEANNNDRILTKTDANMVHGSCKLVHNKFIPSLAYPWLGASLLLSRLS